MYNQQAQPVKRSMLPEFVVELFRGLASFCRLFRKVTEGLEDTTDGVIELSAIRLRQLKDEMNEPLPAAPEQAS